MTDRLQLDNVIFTRAEVDGAPAKFGPGPGQSVDKIAALHICTSWQLPSWTPCHYTKLMEVRKVPQIWKEALACPMPTFSQHGSQQGRSMTTNLLEYLEKLAEFLNKGDSFDIIYLDFVRHLMLFSESLLRKLEGWVWWTRC